MSPLALAQFARIVGHAAFCAGTGLPADAPVPLALTEVQQERVRALATGHATRIADAFLEEAAALDDIQDAGAAIDYLEERLAFFTSLLTDGARTLIRQRFLSVARQWGPCIRR